MPAPVALARLVDSLTPLGVREPVWEPKWDGYRALCAGGVLYSRNATNLTPLFPDLSPVLAARLPADLLLDGELVAWDTDHRSPGFRRAAGPDDRRAPDPLGRAASAGAIRRL